MLVGCYVMISPNPETDVNNYMDNWAINSGLKASNPNAKRIGWDFPFLFSLLREFLMHIN